MRECCCKCAVKHVSQAIVLLLEARYVDVPSLGADPEVSAVLAKAGPEHNHPKPYGHHRYLAMAHLAEAADELIISYPAEANMIKHYRKLMEANEDYNPPLMDIMKHLIELEEA